MVMIKKPKFLILDEPSAGLSPANVKKIYQILDGLKQNLKISLLLIEQNVNMAFKFSDKSLLLEEGLLETQAMDFETIEERYFG